ncbi:MAG: 50S ribosomal protein L29 [Patescibacteria group bacterium]
MKIKELREKTEHELKLLLTESREAIRILRFRIAVKELKDVRELREKRLLVSRILTLLREKKSH